MKAFRRHPGGWAALPLLLLLTGCTGLLPGRGPSSTPPPDALPTLVLLTPSPTPSPTAPPPATDPPTPFRTDVETERAASPTHAPSPSPSPTRVPPATATAPPPTATPDPFEALSIDALGARPYGGSGILIGEVLAVAPLWSRYAIRYPGDGLWISGTLHVPAGPGPFPVVLLNHGYYDPARYLPGDGTQGAAERLAAAGYLTIASDYRGHAASDAGPNPFRSGYVIDVMNLLAQIDSLPADWAIPSPVGLWGHSMGGAVTVNVAVLGGARVAAAVVYGGMSADVATSTRHVLALWGRSDYVEPVAAWGGPEQHEAAYRRMSALHHLERSGAAFSIHHGTADEQVPYPWSERLRDAAAEAGRGVEHFAYPAARHRFEGETWTLFMERVIAFYDRTLPRP